MLIRGIGKKGFIAGAQCYKCKQCEFQVTRDKPHGKPMCDKVFTLILCLSGLSMKMIGKITGVRGQNVMRWIRMFHKKFIAEDTSVFRVEEIELDEMVFLYQ